MESARAASALRTGLRAGVLALIERRAAAVPPEPEPAPEPTFADMIELD